MMETLHRRNLHHRCTGVNVIAHHSDSIPELIPLNTRISGKRNRGPRVICESAHRLDVCVSVFRHDGGSRGAGNSGTLPPSIQAVARHRLGGLEAGR